MEYRILRLFCCLCVALAAQASTSVFQASFEKSNPNWTAVRGVATPDSTVMHGTSESLRLEPAETGGGPSGSFLAGLAHHRQTI